MISRRRISGVCEGVGAFLRCEGLKQLPDRSTDGFDRSGGAFAQQVLEFGEDLFDRVQVGGVFWQEDELGAGRAGESAHGFALVAAEIVHDDDVAWLQGGDEDALDISSEVLAIDWTIKDPWGVNPVMAQGDQESRGLPVAVRDLGIEPLATRRPSPQGRHVGLGPGLVDEDRTLRVNWVLIVGPLRPPPGNVRTIAFAGDDAFF